MNNKTEPMFGDNVRIRSTPETESWGFAGRCGTVSGFTTPSSTGIEVVGRFSEDYALAVMFEDPPACDAWFARELVEFIDHGPGTEIRIGNIKAVRNSDGTWIETRLDGAPLGSISARPRKTWWKFWTRG